MTSKSEQVEWAGSWSRGHAVPAMLMAVAVVGVVAAAGPAQAQEERTGRVIVGSANVRKTCSLSAEVLGARSEGDRVEILESMGAWHRVRLYDGQEACMHESVLEVESGGGGEEGTEVEAEQTAAAYTVAAGDEESAEIVAEIEERRADLAAAEDEDEAEEIRGEIAELEAELAERQAEIEGERLAAAREEREAALQAREALLNRQAETTQRTKRRASGGREMTGFIDLSYGVAWAASEDEEWQTLINPNAGGGVTDDRITYHLPRGDAFSVGGGVLFGQIGAALRVSQQTHEDPADIHLFSTFARRPFQVEARAITATDLERKEQGAHLSFVYAPLQGERFQLRLFVGPSYFDVTQDTIDDVFATEVPFEIVGFLPGEQDDTATGFHVGADASWYWGQWGVGLAAYYSQGEVEFRDRYGETFRGVDAAPQKVDVGGTQLLGGFRLRF